MAKIEIMMLQYFSDGSTIKHKLCAELLFVRELLAILFWTKDTPPALIITNLSNTSIFFKALANGVSQT